MKEWNSVDSIRDDLIEMIWNVKRHYQSITISKVSDICNDAAKIMSLIQSYKEEEITAESLLQQVNQIIDSMDKYAERESFIEYINNHLSRIITSDIKDKEVNTNFWEYYVSYC